MIRKTWTTTAIRGDKSLRAYRDHFNNHPYQKLVTLLNDRHYDNPGELALQKYKRYGQRYLYGNHEFKCICMYTAMRNKAHYLSPEYSFYGWIEINVFGLSFKIGYNVNFTTNNYKLKIDPLFDFQNHKDWIITIPMHTRMNEASIIALATVEIKKVILPPGTYQDVQLLSHQTATEVKQALKAYSFKADIARDRERYDYDQYIIRCLRKKHNVRADFWDDAAKLLNLLTRLGDHRYTTPQRTVTEYNMYREVSALLSETDGDVDDIERIAFQEFKDTIII
jgi:hypothetical protein